ncbi:MAG TPA: UDP-N-acetylmuramate:L-alanyl-gamma-D-glutamyl-meso-diaminopimelate ligase [Gammaproteobacteria bacterium]|nr:UDP-N-acetylmuramate:L-alanyl-gamma-D-glutamyl-meso-diaminopimelate ligase [Gammaproteobacteria bacterium]
MHIYILGIAGTFMAGIARLAKAAGHQVSGVDEAIYPPMSTQLEEDGIDVFQGYDAAHLAIKPDCVIIGNAMKRGNVEVEAVLAQNLRYMSAPEWLYDQVLRDRHVIAVSGTHGKTTTTNMLVWILTAAGKNPGYLIGGVPKLLPGSAVFGLAPYFVIEADEYDTAFFDKRSKFIHYHPKTLLINNLEFDHADIFNDLEDIKKQFHYLVRTVPNTGKIIYAHNDENIRATLKMGCWTPTETVGLNEGQWSATDIKEDGSAFTICHEGKALGTVAWEVLGLHNVQNALAACACAFEVGVPVSDTVSALQSFQLPARRMEVKGVVNEITIYDDFAHHPTAMKTTLAGLRARVGQAARIIVCVEMRSYTMRHNVHGDKIMESLLAANQVLIKKPSEISLSDLEAMASSHPDCRIFTNTQQLIDQLKQIAKPHDHILIMSNGAFDGIYGKLLSALA